MKSLESTAKEILELADVTVNGKQPHDITVHDTRLYKRVIRDGELGLGESYMDGWWDAPQVDMFVEHVLSADLDQKVKITPGLVGSIAAAKLLNQQTVKKAHKDVSSHYDIGNDLYEKMLDARMIYTCAYWNGAKTLDQAQENKLDLVCRKLQLKKGMTVLDLGCGWGGFAEYAADNYGVKVTGVTLSAEQVKLAKQRIKNPNVKVILKDYRDIKGTFDRVVSIGILEHVGLKNYKTFFEVCNQRLAPGGVMLHHMIANNHQDTPKGSRWIRKYIFPGTELPTLIDFAKAIEWKFVVEDVHNIGPDYDKTLMAWHKNFVKHYNQLDQDVYDERFYRMWNYYLLSIAATFRTRKIQLYQIVMRRIETSDTYKSVR
jgi:cyclopropane-fatty-acyl-phospholipid synthase